MKKIKQAAAVLSMLVLLVSCSKMKGEGPTVSEERTITGFSGLVLKVPARTIFTQGTDYKVELLAQQNILDEIITEKQGNDLVIRFRKNNTNVSSHDEPVFRITMPFLDKAEIHGSGNLTSASAVNAELIDLLINGSGFIEFNNLSATELFAKINGSGKIRVKAGVANNSDLEISGSGDIEVADLESKQAEVHISGSGKVEVNASETLKIGISGSGKVKYRGNPVITSNVSGSGSVGRL
ncbi:MAG: DUF2807 domain-containing protein [Chitinophagaceae bacterium]|nr:MAG: DUF2807 domain-containing protein [Chitinophagaceae bacterium]